MSVRSMLAIVIAGGAAAAASALPAHGEPGVVQPAPGETRIAPAPTADEDRVIVATEAERQRLVASLEAVVACARGRGAEVPSPVPVETGALLPFGPGEPDAATEEALEECVPDLGGHDDEPGP